MNKIDVVIIGGGIAGLSAGWALSDSASVILIEQESATATHSTGRSAALISETYGPIEACALAAASRTFLTNPPEGFSDLPLLSPRGLLWISDTENALDKVTTGAKRLDVQTQRLTAAKAHSLVPVLREEWLGDALLEPDAMDIDVAALVASFRAGFLRRGGKIELSNEAIKVTRTGNSWEVTTPSQTIGCDVVVNAGGAWADTVAVRSGIQAIGLQPYRRTMFMFPVPDYDMSSWPLVMDAGGRFYFEAESGGLLASPAEETPTEPHDARADELAMAKATDELATATTLVVKGVKQKWAGLRTFAKDRLPVVGFEPDAPGFFWLAGQGGAGIKTSPALATLTRALILDEEIPADLAATGLNPKALEPGRFRS